MIKINKTKEQQQKDFREMAEASERINGTKCYKCGGTGTDGWHTKLEQYLPCVCVIKASMKARKQIEEKPVMENEISMTPEVKN